MMKGYSLLIPVDIPDGTILHVRRRDSFISRLIIRTLRSWGCHDAMVIHGPGTQTWVGESVWPRAALTDIKAYANLWLRGKVEVQFLWPKAATEVQGQRAATYWLEAVQGRPYDCWAYPRLLLKATCMDLSQSRWAWLRRIGDRRCGMRWANWCTEGVADGWTGALGRNIWQSGNPTPLTTEHRIADGTLDVR